MKKVQENSIKLFNETIFNKVKESQALHYNYDKHVSDLKKIDNKIDYYKRNGDYAEATRLKREQKDLEDKMVKIDDQFLETDFSVSEDEFNQFYEAYKKELTPLKDEHENLRKEMKDKIKELAEVYKRLQDNKNQAGRRISRKQYVDSYKDNGSKNLIYKGQLLSNEINIGGDVEPIHYGNYVEDELKKVRLEAYQEYYYDKKQW